ncbi:hypothetical protein T4B_11346 [Trichinella pseudospiralis]|uniref:Uncharacterized protein n=1 Tax=Trichinella pseudospiralis TaxID=6337 RepID=A0A0V1IB26_TRIPS|nr:hypothetical protein T4B_11346 [Trichinella pseudospiralis]
MVFTKLLLPLFCVTTTRMPLARMANLLLVPLPPIFSRSNLFFGNLLGVLVTHWVGVCVRVV